MSKAKDFVEKNFTDKDDPELTKELAKYNEEVAAANKHLEAAYKILDAIAGKSSTAVLRTLARRGNLRPVSAETAKRLLQIQQHILSNG